MGAVVEALITSLNELSKRKVKRSAHIWISRLNEIYKRRCNVNERQVPIIIRHIVDNHLEGQPKAKELLQYLQPTVLQLDSLDLVDTAALCYALCTINADTDARALLYKNVDEARMANADLFSQSILLRSVAICISRHKTEYAAGGNGIQGSLNSSVYDCIIRKATDTIRNVQSNMNFVSVDYKVIGNLLVETIFILDLLKKDLGFSGSHCFVDYSALDGRILVSHLLSAEHRNTIEKQISTSCYSDILSILRRFYYMQLPHHHYVQNLFVRLANTSGAATHMCRADARIYLDEQIRILERNVEQQIEVPCQLLAKELLSYLIGIKNTGILGSGHISTHRWNYPMMTPQNG